VNWNEKKMGTSKAFIFWQSRNNSNFHISVYLPGFLLGGGGGPKFKKFFKKKENQNNK
jgi:hypothetical protein